MKNIRKILCAVLALAMLFSLAACGSGDQPSDNSQPLLETASPPTTRAITTKAAARAAKPSP